MSLSTDEALSREFSLFNRLLNLFLVVWILLHIYTVWKLPFSLDELKILHLGFAISTLLFSLFLAPKTEAQKYAWHWLVVSILTVFVTIFFFADYGNMIERSGMPSTSDVIAGTILVALVLLITWRIWGFVIPLLTVLVLLYAFFGHYLSGFFFHSGIDYPRLIGYSGTYFMGTLGNLTGLSASMIIHFLLFGALLQAAGGTQLIEKVSIIIGSRFRSGAAQTAVISSGALGMVSGSTAANIAITGAFTIPLMKKRGYHQDFAGAVETVASTGGQIMPPIMGVSAFIIAGLTNIPYSRIVIAAFLPAMVYFLNLSFAIWVHTRKSNILLVQQDLELPTIRFLDIAKQHGHLVVPVIILTWRILIGETPAKAVLMANITLMAVGTIHAFVFGVDGRWDSVVKFGRQVYSGLAKGALEASKLAVVLAAMGIIVEMFTVTGFGQRLSYTMVDIAGRSSLILIALVAVLTIFFGMGMPTPGAYLLTVLLSAPTLVKFGFELLSVHLFVFYFAIISALTPPVAIGVLVAIGISGGRYVGTALNALRLALPGFLMPFFFLYKPVMLGLAHRPIDAFFANLLLLIAAASTTIFFDGYFLKRVGWNGRIAFLVGALMVFFPDTLLTAFGLGIIFIAGIYCFYVYAKSNPSR
jgi:TRAP transporter 4TM/12TM fusion protein